MAERVVKVLERIEELLLKLANPPMLVGVDESERPKRVLPGHLTYVSGMSAHG